MKKRRPAPTPKHEDSGPLPPTLTVRVRALQPLSHSKARALIESGGVTVDGEVVTDPVARPAEDAVVACGAPQGARRPRALRGPGFRVLHIDRDLVVVDKDPGVIVVPRENPDEDDPPLVSRVGATLQLAGHRVRDLWVVHRIDRATSGLVLFARREEGAEALLAEFHERRTGREYLAWTQGVPRKPEGRLTHRLLEDRETHAVTVTDDPNEGREAILDYRVEAHRGPVARLAVSLVTGRRNQIRAQLAAIGHPLLGDHWYGSRHARIGRAALHAHRLSFPHPHTRDALRFEAPIPADLQRLERELLGDKAQPRQ